MTRHLEHFEVVHEQLSLTYVMSEGSSTTIVTMFDMIVIFAEEDPKKNDRGGPRNKKCIKPSLAEEWGTPPWSPGSANVRS